MHNHHGIKCAFFTAKLSDLKFVDCTYTVEQVLAHSRLFHNQL